MAKADTHDSTMPLAAALAHVARAEESEELAKRLLRQEFFAENIKVRAGYLCISGGWGSGGKSQDSQNQWLPGRVWGWTTDIEIDWSKNQAISRGDRSGSDHLGAKRFEAYRLAVDCAGLFKRWPRPATTGIITSSEVAEQVTEPPQTATTGIITSSEVAEQVTEPPQTATSDAKRPPPEANKVDFVKWAYGRLCETNRVAGLRGRELSDAICGEVGPGFTARRTTLKDGIRRYKAKKGLAPTSSD